MTEKNVHNSERLNAILGKQVRIVMFDGSVETGVLYKSEHMRGYMLERPWKGNLHFYKTHIKKIEEVKNAR